MVWELSWSGLAAGRLKGVHSDGSLCLCCHPAAVAGRHCRLCVCACVPVSGRVCVCVQRLAFTIYTKGWEEAGKGRAWGRWLRGKLYGLRAPAATVGEDQAPQHGLLCLQHTTPAITRG